MAYKSITLRFLSRLRLSTSKNRKNVHVHHSFFISLTPYVYKLLNQNTFRYVQQTHNDSKNLLVHIKSSGSNYSGKCEC